MKRINAIIAALASVLLFSCTKNEISEQATVDNKEEGYKYIFIIDSENDAKTVIDGTTVQWETGDRIGIFANGSQNTYGYISTLSPSVQFPIYLKAALSASEKIYCYYPYNYNSTASTLVSMSIPESQSGDSDAMPQVALPYTVTEAMAAGTTNVGNIKFCNLGSVARFHVCSSKEEYRSETVQSICFTANAALAGTFTFNAEEVDYSDQTTLEISGYDKTSVTISTSASVPESKDDAEDIDMILAPGSYSGTIVVTTDQATYTYTLSSAKTFTRSTIKPLNIDLKTGTRVEKPANCSWNLSTNDYDSATEELVTWTSDAATMTNAKGEGTKANNYLGGTSTYTHTRMYVNNIFTITPKSGYKITSAEFTSTSDSYAQNIKTSTWTNASAAASGTITTLTPTDGTQSFYATVSSGWRVTGVTLYYEIVATKQLSSIALGGDYKTSFKTTDEFSFGGTVTATFDDQTQEDVTSGTEFSGYDLSTPGNQTVTASYTYAGVTKTADYNITVTGSPSISAEDITDVPAAGVKDGEASYTVQYFTDDVEVASVTGPVTEAIVNDGTILYTVEPNYTLSTKSGTIVLQSAGDNTVTKTINVTQKSSKLTVSATEVVIPYDSYSTTFTITSAEMGWNTAVTLESGMNITLNPESGNASADAQAVKVSTTIEASESGVQTLGTISVYRNGNTSDSQKKTITVKRAQKPSSTTKYYVKATTISEGTYLFVRDGKTVSNYASNALTLEASVTFTNDKIASDATVDGYAITITEVATGKYSIKWGTYYIGYNSSTKFKTTTTAPTSSDDAFLWTVSVLSDGTFKFINVGTTSRIIAANNNTSATQLKPYSSSNVPSTNPCPYLYKKED